MERDVSFVVLILKKRMGRLGEISFMCIISSLFLKLVKLIELIS